MQANTFQVHHFNGGGAHGADITLAAAMLAWQEIREVTPGAADIESGGYAAGLAAGARYFDATH